MALQGNLRDFSITQLLNLINLACKTGTLVIEGPSDTAQLAFRDGKLSFAQIGQEDSTLPTVLASTRKITAQQSASLKIRAATMTDKELGLLLINAGFFSQDVILTSLQEYYLDIVRRLFTWVEGFFHFNNDMIPADGKILVRVDLENLIIEGSRQLKEMVQLQEEIPIPGYGVEIHRSSGCEPAQYQLERGRMAGGFVYQSQKFHPADCAHDQNG